MPPQRRWSSVRLVPLTATARRARAQRLRRLLAASLVAAFAGAGFTSPPPKALIDISDPSVVDITSLHSQDDGDPNDLLAPGDTIDTTSTVFASEPAPKGGTVMHQVTLVLATWSGLSPDGDATTRRTQLTSLINNEVSSFWQTATNGAVAFQVSDSHGWITTTNKPCDAGKFTGTPKFWEEVRDRVKFTPGTAKHLLVYFPPTSACGGTAGMATVSPTPGISSGGSVWINGSRIRSLYAHELGHNLGLGHSNTIECTSGGVRVTDAPAGDCASRDYADITDVMGVSHSNAGALNPIHLRTLGLLNGPDVQDVALSSTFEVAPLSSPPTTTIGAPPRTLRIALNGDTYFIVYRSQTGLDAWLDPSFGNGDPGVAIYRIPSTGFEARSSYLADADPSSADATYATTRTILETGKSVTLQGGAVTIRTLGVVNGRAVVEVTRAGDTQTVGIPLEENTTEDLGPGPQLAFTGRSISPGTLTLVNGMWTAPMTASWTSSTALTSQVFDGATLVTSARTAPTRLNVGLNKTAGDALNLAVTSISGNAAIGQAMSGLIWTDAPRAGVVSYSGSWSRATDTGAHAGYVRTSSTRGSAVTITTTGRSFGVVAQRGVNHGIIDVYVNGVKKATVDLEAKTTSKRRIVYRAGYGNVAKRTVTLVHRGSGVVRFDGLVELN
jgi:hypothetical protein